MAFVGFTFCRLLIKFFCLSDPSVNKNIDEDGIRTHACRAHWISSPTLQQLGHLVIMEAAVTTVPEYVLTFSATWGGVPPSFAFFGDFMIIEV